MDIKSIVMRIFSVAPKNWENAARARYRGLRDRLGLWRAGWRDIGWYARQSGVFDTKRKGVLQARIIKTYHALEKGLALPAPRPGFGQVAAAQLLDAAQTYLDRFGPDRTLLAASATLDEYLHFNAGIGVALPEIERGASRLREALPSAGTSCLGGTLELTREAIHGAGKLDLRNFFQSRYSIRQFSTEPVATALIEQAVRMAQKAPSVCNRESGRVYVVGDREKARALLRYQNGNRGFGDQANKLLVITARLDCFLTIDERYQHWIDGGLFAMSVIYALHSLGLGSCCLNWSVDPAIDRAFKEAAGIADDQSIIMLLAVGHLPARLRVARSERRPLDDVLIHI